MRLLWWHLHKNSPVLIFHPGSASSGSFFKGTAGGFEERGHALSKVETPFIYLTLFQHKVHFNLATIAQLGRKR